MLDSDESGVTHTEISSLFEDLSDIGSPGVVGPKHEGLPWMLDDPYVQVTLQAPPSPDYIPGPEEPQSPPLPDFVLEPVYPEYMPQEDVVFPAEEQPLPAAASPTAQSPDYVLESDPEADPEEDDDDDPEEDPDDEDDDEVDIEADDDKEEEEQHPHADSKVVALPAADQAPSAEETKPFETDESAATPPLHLAYRVTARISILALVPTPVWSDVEVARLLAISTPSSSPLSPCACVISTPPASPNSFSWAIETAWIQLEPRQHLLPITTITNHNQYILSHTRPQQTIIRGTHPGITPQLTVREDRPEVTLPATKRGIGVHMHVLLDSWRLRLGCLERLGDDLWMREADSDFRDAGGRSLEAEAVYKGTEADKGTTDSDVRVIETVGTRQRSCTARATGGGW
ncbi:hypothetical protein Tco_0503912 [Tanacetum coccineum]